MIMIWSNEFSYSDDDLNCYIDFLVGIVIRSSTEFNSVESLFRECLIQRGGEKFQRFVKYILEWDRHDISNKTRHYIKKLFIKRMDNLYKNIALLDESTSKISIYSFILI